MGFLKAVFSKKKAGAAGIGIIAALLTQVGLPEEISTSIAQLAMAFIAGQGITDLGLALKGVKTE